MKRDDPPIVSRKRLAHQLGCSTKTISRMFARGQLDGCFKVGGRTSPLKMTTKALDKLRRGRKGR